MKNIIVLTFLFFIKTSYAQVSENALIPNERHTITSTYLEEERTFQVYLPPNYFYSEKGNFPVIYLMDGDYNFFHDAGLIEFLSTVANRIPEMIIVGISDKGSTKYRNNCKPTTNSESSGNADNFMSFLEKELKPHIQKNYRASDYDILIGHSMGGLFVVNHFLERPKVFDTHIAIDPSLWWGDYMMTPKADSIFKNQAELQANLFISLADTRGMGVRPFVGILDKYFPSDSKWNFQYYENENHGSVHQITIRNALEKLFKNWEISQQDFYALESAQGIIDHYKKLSDEFSTSFSIPVYSLGNMMYYYYRKNLTADLDLLEQGITTHFPSSLSDFYIQLARNHLDGKKYKEAEDAYKKCLESNPNAFLALEGLAKIHLEKKAYQPALEASNQSILIAKKLKVRQWQMNEIQSTNERIKAEMKK